MERRQKFYLFWCGLLLAAMLTSPVGIAVALPGVSISNSAILAGPSGTQNASFQVTLSAPASSVVSVAYATGNGTATAGVDYSATSGTASFPIGVTSETVSVPVLGTAADASGLTFNVVLSSPVNATITSGTGTCTITHDAVPQAVSVNPNPALAVFGESEVLTTTANSAAGASNLANIDLSVGTLSAPSTSLYAQYVVSTNLLFLGNSSGAYIGGFAPGSNNVITTGLASLNCAGSSVITNGNQVSVSWDLTPTASLRGTQSTYVNVKDNFALSSGWENLGTWAIYSDVPPVPVSVSPSAQYSLPNQFATLTSVCSSAGGSRNINKVGFSVGPLTTPNVTVFGEYVASTNLLYLANASGTYIGGFAPGSNNVITTPLASLNCAATSVSATESALTINWSMSISSALLGVQGVDLIASDKLGEGSNWVNLGTWTVSQEAAPLAVSVTPNPAASLTTKPELITSTCSSVGGAGNLSGVGLSVGQLTSPAASLYAKYVAGTNSLYLANAAGTYVGGFAPGSNHVITTSLASLNCEATSVSASGGQLSVSWSLTPSSSLAGSQGVYVLASDKYGMTSSWQQLGNWQLSQEMPPVAVSVSPNPLYSQPGGSMIFSTTCSSTGGPGNLNKVGLSLGALASPSTTLYAQYVAGSNLLYLADASGNYQGGIAPGSATGITTSLGTLDCEHTTVTSSGNQVTVTWRVIPSTSFQGTEGVYLNVVDNFGMTSGWTRLANWTVFGNDLFANAQAISGQSGSVVGTTVYSFLETNEPNPPHPTLGGYGGAGYDSVWYLYTAPGGTTSGVTFTAASGADVVNVYSGSVLATLRYVNGGLGTVYAGILPGVQYYVQVMDYSNDLATNPQGPFTLSWSAYSLPANNNFALAQVLAGTSGSVTGTTLGATVEPSEPASPGGTVWYQFTAPSTGPGGLQINESGQFWTEPGQ